MNILLKKLFFVIPTICLLFLLLYLSQSFINNWQLLFSLDFKYLERLLTLVLLLNLVGLWLAIFMALAEDFRIVLPVSIILGLEGFLFFPPSIALVLLVGIFVSTVLGYLMIYNKLKSYVTFDPSAILLPGIKIFNLCLILTLTLAFYLVTNIQIVEKGFKIPDPIIETVLNTIPNQFENTPNIGSSNLSIPKSQLDQLQQNPEILKQYGITPELLKIYENSLKATGNVGEKVTTRLDTNEFIKNSIKSQVDQIIKPYLKVIPIILALIFFVSLSSISGLISWLLPLFIFLIFYILEKSSFISFVKEMREVKKIKL